MSSKVKVHITTTSNKTTNLIFVMNSWALISIIYCNYLIHLLILQVFFFTLVNVGKKQMVPGLIQYILDAKDRLLLAVYFVNSLTKGKPT